MPGPAAGHRLRAAPRHHGRTGTHLSWSDGRLRRTARLVSNRNVALLWWADGFSHRGAQAGSVAMPLLVLAVTGSPAKAGVVGLARSLAYPLTPVPAGAVVRRLSPRLVVIVCSFGRAMALGSLALAIALGRPSYLQLQVVAFLSPALWSVSEVAKRDLRRAAAPRGERPAVEAVARGRQALGEVGGPLVGGILFQIGEALPFLVEAGDFLVAVVLTAAVRVRVDADPPPSQPPKAFRRALAWQWRQPVLRLELLVFAAANVTLTAVALLVVVLARRYGDSPRSIGLAFAIIGAGALIGAGLARAHRPRVSGRRLILLAPWTAAVLVPALLAFRSAATLGAVAALMFLPMALASSALLGADLSHTPEELRGPVADSAQLVAGSISWVGPLAAGALFQDHGPTTTVLALAAWSLAIALVATTVRSARRGLPAPT